MIKQKTTLARRYAKAFCNVFGESLTFDDFEHIVAVVTFLDAKRTFVSWLTVPLISDEVKITVLRTLLIENFTLPESFMRLIELLVSHNRSFMIDSVLYYIGLIYQERNAIQLFTVTSAPILTAADKKTISLFLAHKIPGAMMYTCTEDKKLIAGLRMQSNTMLWEYSIRKDLRTLDALTRR